jgi:hypothetical protein
MSLYYNYVNIDKRECIDGDSLLGGVKWGSMSSGLMPHLLVHVLTEGGRVASEESGRAYAGRWAGDRVVVAHDGRDSQHLDQELRDITLEVVKEVWGLDNWTRGVIVEHVLDNAHFFGVGKNDPCMVWVREVVAPTHPLVRGQVERFDAAQAAELLRDNT